MSTRTVRPPLRSTHVWSASTAVSLSGSQWSGASHFLVVLPHLGADLRDEAPSGHERPLPLHDPGDLDVPQDDALFALLVHVCDRTGEWMSFSMPVRLISIRVRLTVGPGDTLPGWTW
ncbi:hypothetical protein GCM10010278_23170 [Streptomyces melanogenes]|nr:hypothetical protein GCM10010278_23170 [Streptomyces melanogenes]